MTLRYRPIGQQEWKQGAVENISRSGVLFKAQEEVAVRTAVDLAIVLESTRDHAAPEVVCWAEIVRSQGRQGQPVLAAKIVDYDIVRPGGREAFAAVIPLVTGDRDTN